MEKIWYNAYYEGIAKEIDPDRYASIVDLFERKCEKFSDLKAVTNMGTSLTFRELEEKSRHFASYLQNTLYLKKGERFAIMLPNCIQYYIALFGALRAGLTVVNVNPLYTPRELTHQLKDAGVKSLVVMANFAHTVESSLPDLNIKNIILTQLGDMHGFPKAHIINIVVKYYKRLVPPFFLPHAIDFNTAIEEGAQKTFFSVDIIGSDIAFLQYTGGTTGVAKGAILTHRNMVANILQVLEWIKGSFEEGKDITISPLPLYHIFSLTASCFVMIALGAENVLITNPRDIPHFIKELKSIPFTLMFSINTLCNALLNNEEFKNIDFSHLKACISGGMSTTETVARRWEVITGVPITEGYGLTETSPVVTINSFKEGKFTGGIGYPVPSTEVDIRDDAGNSVDIGEIGELYVRGPQVMQGYWNLPDETNKVLLRDGWLRTGDIARMNEEGLVSIVDRKKDMILISGFNVYPNEVEEVLVSHPLILEAAVIGVPDEDHIGEQVKAVIVRKDPSLTHEEVINHCRKSLTPYKIPHSIEFRDELPKTPVGKVLRRLLREEEKVVKDAQAA
jgi:long-chain acyl-CoA synthetase